MNDLIKQWLDLVFDLQPPPEPTLTFPFEERNRVLEALQTRIGWDETDVIRDPGGNYTGHATRYNNPRTTHVFMPRSSCQDGEFLQVKLTYGKNRGGNVAWLSYKKVNTQETQ